jgi:hypothetical protein
MLKWFRARADTWAMLALWSFTALGTLSTAHEIGCGDELAPVLVAVHVPGAHTVAPAGVTQRPDHCVLCHWMRSFRAGGVRSSRIVLAHRAVPARMTTSVQPTRAVARLDLPPRAPPA